MKCEICHKADAETVLKLKKKDGSVRELYVCKACAAAAKRPKKKTGGAARTSVTVIGPGGEENPPPFVEEFFKAAMGLVDGLGHMADEKKKGKKSCPSCKATWEQIQKTERLGCPTCWKTFAAEIRKEILGCDYGKKHVGGMPSNTTGEDARAWLERELAAAVQRQDYEKAAELQRRLGALDDGKGPSA